MKLCLYIPGFAPPNSVKDRKVNQGKQCSSTTAIFPYLHGVPLCWCHMPSSPVHPHIATAVHCPCTTSSNCCHLPLPVWCSSMLMPYNIFICQHIATGNRCHLLLSVAHVIRPCPPSSPVHVLSIAIYRPLGFIRHCRPCAPMESIHPYSCYSIASHRLPYYNFFLCQLWGIMHMMDACVC